MATKVGLENNLLIIDDGVKRQYLNSAWCSISFDTDSVVILNNVSLNLHVHDYKVRSNKILFTDFQDLDSTAYASESAIATYLSDKIG